MSSILDSEYIWFLYLGDTDYNSIKTKIIHTIRLTNSYLHSCTKDWWYPVVDELVYRLHIINFHFNFSNWDVAQCVTVQWKKMIPQYILSDVKMEQNIIVVIYRK